MNKRKFYNISLAVMSILNGYAFIFMRGFSIAMIITTFFAILSLIEVVGNGIRIDFHQLISFVVLSICLTLFSLSSANTIDYSRVIYTALKLLVWSFYLSFGGLLYFDAGELLSAMKGVIVITFMYLMAQYAAHYVLHVSVPASFNLGVIVPNSSDYEYLMDASSSIFRPGSLWGEPGYLGYYYNSFLCILLFTDRKYEIRNKVFYLIVTCAGITLSMSSGAIGIMIILVFMRLVTRKQVSSARILITILVMIVIGYMSIENGHLDSFRGFNKSIDNTLWKLENLESVGRVGQSFDLLDRLSLKQLLFGLGLGNELFITKREYMNGIVTIIFWVGLIGLAAWIITILSISQKFSHTILQKMMLIIFLFDGIYAGLYFGAHSFIYILVGAFGINCESIICNETEELQVHNSRRSKYIRYDD